MSDTDQRVGGTRSLWGFALALGAALGVGGCDVPDTNRAPDADISVSYRLGLTTRYLDPEAALDGLSVWVDDVNYTLESIGITPVDERYPNIGIATGAQHQVEIRYGPRVLDSVLMGPGDTCASERGDDNRLLSESVNLCLRPNGEIQISDFSCEYESSGFFTADVFCPTDCHPLLGGGRACGGQRCGLVLSNLQPRYGALACVEAGARGLGESCRPPEVGQADSCSAGLACVGGSCMAFCLSDADCPDSHHCVSALSNPSAEPYICLDPEAAARAELAQP